MPSTRRTTTIVTTTLAATALVAATAVAAVPSVHDAMMGESAAEHRSTMTEIHGQTTEDTTMGEMHQLMRDAGVEVEQMHRDMADGGVSHGQMHRQMTPRER